MKGYQELFIPSIVVVPDVPMFFLSFQFRKLTLYPCYSWGFWGSAASVQFMFLHWFQQKLIHFTWAQMTSLHCLWRSVYGICFDTRQRCIFPFFRHPSSSAYKPLFFCKMQNQSQVWDSVGFLLPHSEADAGYVFLSGFQWLDLPRPSIYCHHRQLAAL